MSSVYGENIKISIFGQSHSEAIGVVVDGFSAGVEVDFIALNKFMQRRAPGKNKYSTKRREADEVEFLSGLVNGITCGAPICAVIRNTDVRSGDYANFAEIPRPAHADYSAGIKFGGYEDKRGGGHFSGRLTAPLCVAGALCIQLLKRSGIEIAARIYALGGIYDTPIEYTDTLSDTLNTLREREFPVICENTGEKMIDAIETARAACDSVGGVIECIICGLPAGIGSPMFGGVENKIAAAVFGIPAVRGIEFGNGFSAALLRASENNDPFYVDENGDIKTKTNNHGGILGGITTGMPVVFRVAFKPTPSIGLEQDSVNISLRENTKLTIAGRHDPCIVPRALPCVEAAAAVAAADILIKTSKI